MADLLECLLQIKGARESLNRIAALAAQAAGQGEAAAAAVADTAADLASTEQRWQAALALALPNAGFEPGSSAGLHGTGGDGVAAFHAARLATLALLDRCSAADLSARTMVPGLGPVTVADIVAHMLAHDTERLGALRLANRER